MKFEGAVSELDGKWTWYAAADSDGQPPLRIWGGPYKTEEACRLGLVYQLSLMLVERKVI